MNPLLRLALVGLVILVAFAGNLTSSSAELITLETKKYILEIEGTAVQPNAVPWTSSPLSFPVPSQQNSTIRLYAKWPSGRVYRDQYFEVIMTHFEEISNWTMSTDPKYTNIIYRIAEPWVAKSFTKRLGGLTSDNPPVSTDIVEETFDFVGTGGKAGAIVGVYNGSTEINLGPFNVTTVPDSLKLSVVSDSWVFQPSTVAWRFWLNFTMYAPLHTISRYQSDDAARQAIKLDLNTEALNITMWFQNYAVVDGMKYPVNPLDYTLTLPDQGTGIRFTQAWQYPKFTTFNYDPDFSVVLLLEDPGDAPVELAPDGSAAIAPNAFPGWIAAVVVCAAVVIIAIVSVIFFIRNRSRSQNEAQILRGKLARDQVTSHAEPRTSADTRPQGWSKADASHATLTNTV